MDFQQSKTYINLQNAFEGELITSTQYQIYGIKAREQTYIQIGDVFDLVSKFEREHAIIWMRLLNDGEIPDTLQNLTSAAAVEDTKGNMTYREYAQVARDEGYNQIAVLFDGIANIELNHAVVFQSFADEIVNNEVFCKSEEVLWICLNCGNIMGGYCAPAICPICGFPQGYYQVYDAKY